MAKVKFVRDDAGVGDLLCSEEAAELVGSYARDLLARVGAGYSIEQSIVKDRQSALVHTTTYETYKDCLENNTLQKNLY